MSDFPLLPGGEDGPKQAYTNPVTVTFARREVTMHTVTGSELDTVASLSNSVDLAFAGVGAGAFVSLASVLMTVPFTNAVLFSGFVAATVVSGVGTVFFGLRARIAYREAQRRLQEIKRGNLPGPR